MFHSRKIFDGPRETLDKTYQNGSKVPEQRHISIKTMFVICCHALLISQPQPPHTLLEKSSSASMLLEVAQPTWVGGVVVTDRRSLRSILFHHINITQCPRTGPTCDDIVACLAVRSPWFGDGAAFSKYIINVHTLSLQHYLDWTCGDSPVVPSWHEIWSPCTQ